MDSVTLTPPQCFSRAEPLNITSDIFDLLFEFTYDGEGEVVWPEYLEEFYEFLDNTDELYAEEVSCLLSYTLCESPKQWCCSLLVDSVHSLEQLCDLIESTFHRFDLEPLDQKLLQKRKAPHESPMDFWQCFHVLQFQAPKIQMKFPYLWDRFNYYLNKSVHPNKKFEPKPHSAYFSDGDAQSQMDMSLSLVVVHRIPQKTTPPL